MEELILGELTERKIGYGIVQPGESTIGGIPVIKVNNIISGLKSIQDLDTTHPENDQKYRKTRLNGGEIIISVVGTIGKTAIVPMNFKGCNLVRATALIDIKDPILSRWVKYYIDSPTGQSYINGNLNTTVQPTLNIKSLVEMPIPFYGREYAEKVVTILSKIDDKIENNRKINDNLEQQAQALFNYFFVDNINELGDYHEGSLTDIASYLNGLAMQKFRAEGTDCGLPVLKIKELGQGFCDSSSDRCSSYIKDDYVINNGEIIFSWSGTLLVDFWCAGKCGLNQHLFKVTSDDYPKWFIYFWTKHHLDQFIRIAKDKAVTMGHIKRSELDNANVLIPSTEKLDQIGATIAPMIDKLINNRVEMMELSSLRDSLLPKLMSGELKINEIDC